MVFKGMYEHTLDAKGRVFMPAKYREGLGETFVVCQAFFMPCLWVFSNEAFEALSDKLEEFSLLDDKTQRIERILYNTASDVEVDKQGRILLPANLREYAGLEKEVVIAGSRNRVDLWNKQTWEHQQEVDQAAFQDAVADLKARGVRI